MQQERLDMNTLGGARSVFIDMHVLHGRLIALVAKYERALQRGQIRFLEHKTGVGAQFRLKRAFSSGTVVSLPAKTVVENWVSYPVEFRTDVSVG